MKIMKNLTLLVFMGCLTSVLGTDNFYDRLGVAPEASDKEITKAYRKLAVKWHPDKCANMLDEDLKLRHEEQFKLIVEAYDMLKDPSKRKEYDRNTFSMSYSPQEPELKLDPREIQMTGIDYTIGGKKHEISGEMGHFYITRTRKLSTDTYVYSNERAKCRMERGKRRRNFKKPACSCEWGTCGNLRIRYVPAFNKTAAEMIYDPLLRKETEGGLQFESLSEHPCEYAWVIEMKHSTVFTGEDEEEVTQLEQKYSDMSKKYAKSKELDNIGDRELWEKASRYKREAKQLKKTIEKNKQKSEWQPMCEESELPPENGPWEIAFVSAEMKQKWKDGFLAKEHSSAPTLTHQEKSIPIV